MTDKAEELGVDQEGSKARTDTPASEPIALGCQACAEAREALDATGIGGIFDEFTDIPDAIQQMGAWIVEQDLRIASLQPTRPKPRSGVDEAPSLCACGHAQASHVPYPICGDCGFYGCVACELSRSPRCRFFAPGES